MPASAASTCVTSRRRRSCQQPLATTVASRRGGLRGFGQLFAKRAGMTLTSRNTKLVHKVEFLFHTLPSLCYFATVLFQLYFPLAIFVNTNFSWPWLGVNISALAIFWIFYSLTLYRMLGLWRGLANQWRIAGIMVLCWGLSPLLAHAFMEGMISSDATFTRTPKRAATESVTDSMSTNMTGTPVESSTDSNASTDVMLTATVRVPVIASNTASPQTSSHSQASRDQGPSFASVSYATNMTTRTSATAVTDSESEASKSAVPSKRAKASYFTTKITFLPFFEFAVAVWSLFATVAALFGLANAPISESFNTGVLWLSAVVVFSTGCAIGLFWSSLGAIGGMIQGLYMEFTASGNKSDSSGTDESDLDLSASDEPEQSTANLSSVPAVEAAPVAIAAPEPDTVVVACLRGQAPQLASVVEV
eukprot:TRINITY_DN787_c0_g1_i3.p1 TRINITY_DN787_c0_g1~~TRINITY_DN787_c0_g1_i3.p1  ORF type:complete len:420 (-),score=105.48 TRINITY_DN787_c0_g1_i3:155-1414(-)